MLLTASFDWKTGIGELYEYPSIQPTAELEAWPQSSKLVVSWSTLSSRYSIQAQAYLTQRPMDVSKIADLSERLP